MIDKPTLTPDEGMKEICPRRLKMNLLFNQGILPHICQEPP